MIRLGSSIEADCDGGFGSRWRSDVRSSFACASGEGAGECSVLGASDLPVEDVVVGDDLGQIVECCTSWLCECVGLFQPILGVAEDIGCSLDSSTSRSTMNDTGRRQFGIGMPQI